jgi:hypothetical protein
MPRYKWVINLHRCTENCLVATGIQTSGFNRLSTLQVIRRERYSSVEYEVKSAGFGKASPWLAEKIAPTLARALRQLQEHYEAVASKYSGHASALKFGRGLKSDQKNSQKLQAIRKDMA